LLFALIALAGCRERARNAGARDVHSVDAAASSVERPDVRAPPVDVASPPARGAVRCVAEGRDRVLASLAVSRLRLAAHGDEAMLVAEYTSSFAPEPAGDSVDTHASRWWLFDLAHPERNTPARGALDPIVDQRPAPDPIEPDICARAPWGEDAERPVWQSSGWTRWRHASSWGGPACSPCGTIRARVGAPGDRLEQSAVTDVLSEFEVSSVDGFTLGATVVSRHDFRGPEDATHNVCSEVGVVIESLIPSANGFERRELHRTSRGDQDNEPDSVATAVTNVGGVDGVIVTVHGDERKRIELRRIDRRGSMIGPVHVVYTGRYIEAAAAAYVQSQLLLVWTEALSRAPDDRSTLYWLSWDPRSDAPRPPPRVLRAATDSTIRGVSLASDGATLALLWVEQPARGSAIARVAAGATPDALAADVSRGGIVLGQSPTIYATSVAVAGERVWGAFNERVGLADTRPRVRSLRCTDVLPDGSTQSRSSERAGDS